MDHDSLFRYFDRRKHIFDPKKQPDYAAQRICSAVPQVLYEIMDIEEECMEGVAGTWMRKAGKPTQASSQKPFGTTDGGTFAGASKRGTILFFHGGAFVRGDRHTDSSFCCELAQRSNCDVYSTDYALAPEHPFPQGLEECFGVYKALCKRMPKGGFPFSNIVLCGESAGATMALAVANYAKLEGIMLPKGIVLISPCVQFERALPSHLENLETDCMLTNFMEEALAVYFQTNDPNVLKDALASPINGDFTGFPPVYITASDCEALRDDAVALCDRMKGQGVDCTLDMAHGLMHVYPVMTALAEAKDAIGRICRFLEKL